MFEFLEICLLGTDEKNFPNHMIRTVSFQKVAEHVKSRHFLVISEHLSYVSKVSLDEVLASGLQKHSPLHHSNATENVNSCKCFMFQDNLSQ